MRQVPPRAGAAGRACRRGRATALASALLLAACATAPPPPRPAPEPDAVWGFRDPAQGRDASRLTSREQRLLGDGLLAARAGDGPAARKLFAEGVDRAADPVPFRLGLVYAAVAEEDLEGAEEGLRTLLVSEEGYVPAVEALADLAAATGRQRDALDGYRALLRLVPGDRRATVRLEAARRSLLSARRLEAEEALRAGDLENARRAGVALVELDPRAATGFQVLARTAEASGKPEDAYAWAIQARNLIPRDPAWTELVARMAMETARYAEAAGFYDELASGAPVFAEKAETARLEFRIQNLPGSPRAAALSPRLTRVQLAVLLWFTVSEFREDVASGPVEVAVDVVDHPERSALIRAISLGFLAVDRDTHRVGVEAAVSRVEFARHLHRLARLVSRGHRVPSCLASDPPPVSSLHECGILSPSQGKGVSGREALRAIERTARLAREGGIR